MKRELIIGLGVLGLIGCASPKKENEQQRSSIRSQASESAAPTTRANAVKESDLQSDLNKASSDIDRYLRESDERSDRARAADRAFQAEQAQLDRQERRSSQMVDTVMQLGMLEMMGSMVNNMTAQMQDSPNPNVKCTPKPNLDALMKDANALFAKADEQIKAGNVKPTELAPQVPSQTPAAEPAPAPAVTPGPAAAATPAPAAAPAPAPGSVSITPATDTSAPVVEAPGTSG